MPDAADGHAAARPRRALWPLFRPEPDYQLAVCALVITIVIAVVADAYRYPPYKARMSDVVYRAHDAQVPLYLEYEEQGTWPGQAGADAAASANVDRPLVLPGLRHDPDAVIELRDRGAGAFAIVLTGAGFGELRGQELIYRPINPAIGTGTPTAWSCAVSPSTKIPPELVPHSCRGSNDAEDHHR